MSVDPHATRRRSRMVRWTVAASLAIAALAIAGMFVGAPPTVDCCASGPTLAHPLGLDPGGRDVALLLLSGLATSALIAVAATVCAVVFGALYGGVAALLPTQLRSLAMRLVDIIDATPLTLIVITLMVSVRTARAHMPSALDALVDSRVLLVFCIASLQWLAIARVAHTTLSSLSEQAFVRAARIVGMSGPSILWRHIAPHARRPLAVFALLALPSGVVAEGFFSFLGFGVEAPHGSIGTLVAAGARAMAIAPLTFLAPSIVLVSATVALQVLGARLRDELRLDDAPQQRGTG